MRYLLLSDREYICISIVSSSPAEPTAPLQPDSPQIAANPERAKDREFFSEFFSALKPLLSKSIGAPYWKGPLLLVDGSSAEVVAMENTDGGVPFYSIATSCKNPVIADISVQYRERKFRSARHAVLHLERDLNQKLYRGKKALGT